MCGGEGGVREDERGEKEEGCVLGLKNQANAMCEKGSKHSLHFLYPHPFLLVESVVPTISLEQSADENRFFTGELSNVWPTRCYWTAFPFLLWLGYTTTSGIHQSLKTRTFSAPSLQCIVSGHLTEVFLKSPKFAVLIEYICQIGMVTENEFHQNMGKSGDRQLVIFQMLLVSHSQQILLV